ncbi:hypothetical protein BH10CYA1_BH10CYA1_35290 [soil metagenome]
MTKQDTSIPLDKQSRPMRSLVEIDLERISSPGSGLPERGILTVFVSEDIDKCQAKDKHCFKIVWQANSPAPPNMVLETKGVEGLGERVCHLELDGSVETPVEGCFLLGNEHPKLNEAKAICAFSANGITYNQARARDRCYSHLVAQSPNWRLLLRLHKDSTDYLLLIVEDDFVEEHFERAWLVRFKGNS